MEGIPAIYLGRIVSKEHFRTFIYAADGAKKLVESWDEYERNMESGLWFSLKKDALARVPVEKIKRPRKEELINDAPVGCIKDDDFLPKENK